MMFFYVTYDYQLHGYKDGHAVVQLSTAEQAPVARILRHLREAFIPESGAVVLRLTHCRVIGPEDHRELQKLGVQSFKIEKEK